VRAFLATAGLLVLVGSAAAASPGPRTLRTSGSGPIEAIAQDGNEIGWLTSGTRGCDRVHVLTPGRRDRSLPQPPSGSMTCHWDLVDGQPQLAVAARAATALWTLHESGPAPFDYVLAAQIGGPERRIDRLAHANTGTGRWLGGVAGAGRTLAYSWVDVEYVDKLGCLNGGSCQQKIADGGIRVVTRTSDAPLPGAQPALQLVAAAGRLAYISATTVAKDGTPAADAGASLYVVDGASGEQVSHVDPRGTPVAIALTPHMLAVLTESGHRDRISWYDPTDGTKLGGVSVSRRAAPQLAASDQLVVYRVGRMLRGISIRNGRSRVLVKTGANSVGLALAKGRLVWAENRGDTGRLRALSVSARQ
jgi:hypothetical protein